MKYFFSLLALILIFGCSKTQTETSFDENIKIKMIENVDSTKRTLTFSCYTEKNFECSNFYIEHTFAITENKIIINFIKITKPNICLTSIGPASAIINLEPLSNKDKDKDYEIEFNFGSSKVTGQLTITTSAYKVILPPQGKIQFINPALNRIPDNTIYGTVHFHSNTTLPIVQNFIDSLQISGATSAMYIPGDYGSFQIQSNGQILQTQDLGYYFTRYFIFNYSANSGQLKTLVRNFGINYPQLLLITLNTTKGEIFRSWVP